MNYDQRMCCEVETEKCVAAEKEMSIKDHLQRTENALIDLRSVLLNIVEGITKCPRTDDVPKDSGCMQESATIVGCLTEECLSLANRIHSLMF